LELVPDLDIVVQANQDKDIELLYQLGAWEVVQPEFEASLELSAHLLAGMGVSAMAIGRDVQQIRSSRYLELRPARQPLAVSRDLKVAVRDLNGDWYNLPSGSPIAGMTLEETNLRQLTGVSVMAIVREDGEEIDYPNGKAALESGDRLLVVGEPEELISFELLAKGEIAVPQGDSSCQWLRLPANSPWVGQKLSEVDLLTQYGVQVRAIRREGKFTRWPDGTTDLQEGDRLLLCGAFYELGLMQRTASPLVPQSSLKLPFVTAQVSEKLFSD
ncbi:MAG: TrkA C-terminal domain-containing protein, partial [Microcoleus sp.]